MPSPVKGHQYTTGGGRVAWTTECEEKANTGVAKWIWGAQEGKEHSADPLRHSFSELSWIEQW